MALQFGKALLLGPACRNMRWLLESQMCTDVDISMCIFLNFSHYYNKIPDKKQFKEGKVYFWLTVLGGTFHPPKGKVWQQEAETG